MVQAAEAYINGDVATDEPLMGLSRLLQNAIIVRGPHLTVVRQIASSSYISIHTETIRRAITKAANLDQNDQATARDRVASIFRGLAQLVAGLGGKEALSMCVLRSRPARTLVESRCTSRKSRMDSSVANANFEVPVSKAWEPFRAYARRLVNLMAKDPSTSPKGRSTALG